MVEHIICGIGRPSKESIHLKALRTVIEKNELREELKTLPAKEQIEILKDVKGFSHGKGLRKRKKKGGRKK